MTIRRLSIARAALMLTLFACSSSATQESATLHILGGTVEVTSGSGDFALAVEGQALSEGDTIRTGERGRAEIRWFDGSITRLDRGTTLEVESLYSRDEVTVIEVSQGTGNSFHVIRQVLSPGSRFDVETPTAVAGVQGTEYAVFVDAEGSTTVAVLDQAVTVAALGGEVGVDAGLAFSVPFGADEFSTLGPPTAIPDELLEGEWLVFNAEGQRVFAEEIPLPFGLLFDPDGPAAYVASEALLAAGGGVYRVDGAGNAELLVPLFGASGLTLGPDGTVYASDDDNLIHAITPDGEISVAVDLNGLAFPGGLNPNAIAIDADDNLYIALNSAGVIIRLGPERALPGEVIADGLDLPQGLAVAADGVIYFMDRNGTIYWVDPATDDAGILAALGFEGTEGGLSFGPDGTLHAADYLGGRILRVEVPSGDASVCLTGIGTPRGIAFDALDRIYVSSYNAGEVLRFDGCGS